jgi:UDP-N-acetylmuramate-alanine ligase
VKEKYPNKKIMAVFWPHQFERTKTLLEKFPPALEIADKIIIKEIFFVPGRDKKLDVSGRNIVDLINRDCSGKAEFIDDDKIILQKLDQELSRNWILVTVGIPPIYKIADAYLGKESC